MGPKKKVVGTGLTLSEPGISELGGKSFGRNIVTFVLWQILCCTDFSFLNQVKNENLTNPTEIFSF